MKKFLLLTLISVSCVLPMEFNESEREVFMGVFFGKLIYDDLSSYSQRGFSCKGGEYCQGNEGLSGKQICAVSSSSSSFFISD